MTEETETEAAVTTIELSHFATITLNGDGTGSIESPLFDDRPERWEEDPFHVAVDALLSLALLHALAGVDVAGRPYECGIEQQLGELVDGLVVFSFHCFTEKTETEAAATTIELSHFATITLNGDGTGSIESPLFDDRPERWEEDPFHVAVDALLSLALLHALAGVDVAGRPYECGIEQQLGELVEGEAEEG